MALGALIAAIRDADDGGGLVAALPVAGRALIERQARLAARAGADHIVVLVERLPGALTGAIDRLRRDGVPIEVARSAGDAADRFHPDERVLVFADGALTDTATVARLADGAAPALLTLSDAAPSGAFERIDAATRWAGLALVSGEMLRKTVAMLGDWDLHSTLLRRAVGASARRLDIADGADLDEAPAALLVRSRAGAHAATQAGLAAAGEGGGWPARFLYTPFARAVAGALIERTMPSRWLRWGAILGTALGAAALGRGWLAAAMALLIASSAVDALGRLLAGLRLMRVGPGDRLSLLRGVIAGVALLLFGWHRLDIGWAPLAVAAFTVATMAALGREEGMLRRTGGAPSIWTADVNALILLFTPFAAARATVPGLIALALYAALSFGIVQHRLARWIGLNQV